MSNDDVKDRLVRRVLWTMPSGLYVLGSSDGDRLNAMTLNLAIQVSIVPRRIAVAVAKDAYTRELIDAGQAFSLNILNRSDRTAVRKFVKPVQVDLANKTLNGFGFERGTTGAPLLDLATAWIDCRVFQAIDAGDHVLYIGDVADAGLRNPQESPEVLRMEDTRMNYGG